MTGAALLAALAGAAGAVAIGDGVETLAGRLAARPRASAAPFSPRMRGLLRRIGAPAPPGDLARRLDAAGAAATVQDVMALKCLLAVAALAVAVVLWDVLPGRLGTLVVIVAPAAGFVLVDVVLLRRARRREGVLRAEVPDLLDRLRLATEAGLPVGRALPEAARHGHGPLARELRAVAVGATLGIAHVEGLERLRRRCPIPEVEALAAALTRSHRHGAPLGPALAALAAGARAERARRIHDHAQRAAPKIQLVVALLLVPAALLMIAAGMLSGLGG